MIKLDNHRKLNSDEVIRKGDFYRDKHSGSVRPVRHSIGLVVSHYGTDSYDFFRRKHTKKPAVVVKFTPHRTGGDSGTFRKVTATKPEQKTPKMPLVKFKYHSTKHWGAPTERTVKVISMDDTYLIGLDVLEDGGHQFKRFRIDRIRGNGQVTLVSY
jgi:hypothetical protein